MKGRYGFGNLRTRAHGQSANVAEADKCRALRKPASLNQGHSTPRASLILSSGRTTIRTTCAQTKNLTESVRESGQDSRTHAVR
jgi:hypothetical protein